MDSMPISKFKATCLAALEKVRRIGRPLPITRFGRPVADIVPSVPEPVEKRKLGGMKGTAEIVGDIISPLDVEWDALDPLQMCSV